MSYTDQEMLRLHELKNAITENNRQLDRNPDYSATWRDVPMLCEIETILAQHDDLEDREDNLVLLEYLADKYGCMGRDCIAAKFWMQYVQIACALLGEAPDEALEKELCIAVSEAAEARNGYYGVEDDCADLLALVTPVLGAERAAERIKKGIGYVHLRVDPVEASEDYLAVIDAIEQQLDEELGTDQFMGKCYRIWSRKQELLEEFGIEWRSVHRLYPRIHFD